MFTKTLALLNKPTILWTMQDKFDFLCETWWLWIIGIIISIIITLIASYGITKIIIKITEKSDK